MILGWTTATAGFTAGVAIGVAAALALLAACERGARR